MMKITTTITKGQHATSLVWSFPSQ